MDVFNNFNDFCNLLAQVKDDAFFQGHSGRPGEMAVSSCCGARFHSTEAVHQCQKGLSFYLCDNKNPAHVEIKKTLLSKKWLNTFGSVVVGTEKYKVIHHEVVLDDQFSLVIGETHG